MRFHKPSRAYVSFVVGVTSAALILGCGRANRKVGLGSEPVRDGGVEQAARKPPPVRGRETRAQQMPGGSPRLWPVSRPSHTRWTAL